MLDALGPAHVRDVDQAVDLVGDLDEGAELGEVAHLAFDDRAHREAVREVLPGIALGLAQREADPSLIRMSSSETMASTSSPTARIFDGLTTFLVHDISLTWIRPSTPSSISTKAP